MFSLAEAAFWHWNITHRQLPHELLKEFLDLCGYWGVLGVVPMYTKTRNVSLLYSINWVNVALFSCIPWVFLSVLRMHIWIWWMLAETFLPVFFFLFLPCAILFHCFLFFLVLSLNFYLLFSLSFSLVLFISFYFCFFFLFIWYFSFYANFVFYF